MDTMQGMVEHLASGKWVQRATPCCWIAAPPFHVMWVRFDIRRIFIIMVMMIIINVIMIIIIIIMIITIIIIVIMIIIVIVLTMIIIFIVLAIDWF